jgi:hypothetical protein
MLCSSLSLSLMLQVWAAAYMYLTSTSPLRQRFASACPLYSLLFPPRLAVGFHRHVALGAVCCTPPIILLWMYFRLLRPSDISFCDWRRRHPQTVPVGERFVNRTSGMWCVSRERMNDNHSFLGHPGTSPSLVLVLHLTSTAVGGLCQVR